MPKPPGALGVEARKKPCNSILPRTSATSPYLVSESPTLSPHLSPPLQQHERSACSSASLSPQSEAHQLNLLGLMEKLQEPALRIEIVPINLTVGVEQRFWIVHQESGLRVLGQFIYCEAEEILKATCSWNWTVDPRTREPACRYQLLNLLERICKPQKLFEVAA